jgi:hypothetical protein
MDVSTSAGMGLENREIVTKGVRAPLGAEKLMAELNHHSLRQNAEASKDFGFTKPGKEGLRQTDEDNQRIPHGMRNSIGSGAAGPEPDSTTDCNRECGQDGQWLDAHLSRYRGCADHKSDQLPSPQWIYNDRLPWDGTDA